MYFGLMSFVRWIFPVPVAWRKKLWGCKKWYSFGQTYAVLVWGGECGGKAKEILAMTFEGKSGPPIKHVISGSVFPHPTLKLSWSTMNDETIEQQKINNFQNQKTYFFLQASVSAMFTMANAMMASITPWASSWQTNICTLGAVECRAQWIPMAFQLNMKRGSSKFKIFTRNGARLGKLGSGSQTSSWELAELWENKGSVSGCNFDQSKFGATFLWKTYMVHKSQYQNHSNKIYFGINILLGEFSSPTRFLNFHWNIEK